MMRKFLLAITLLLAMLLSGDVAEAQITGVTNPDVLETLLLGPSAIVGTSTANFQTRLLNWQASGKSNTQLDQLAQQFVPSMAAAACAQTVNTNRTVLQQVSLFLDTPWGCRHRYSAAQRGQNYTSDSLIPGAYSRTSKHNSDFWFQGFAYQEDQPLKDGFAGYGAEGYGFVSGFDGAFYDGRLIFGIAYGYNSNELQTQSWTTLEGTTTDPSQVATQTHTVLLYGRVNVSDTIFLSVKAGGTGGGINGRRVPDATNGNITEFETVSNTAFAQVLTGYDLIKRTHFRLMPKLGISYFYYSQDEYVEQFLDDAMGVDVYKDGFAQFDLLLDAGVRLSEWTEFFGTVGYRRVFGMEGAVLSVQSGGLSYSVNGVPPAEDVFAFNFGTRYEMAKGMSLIAEYNFRSGNDQHRLQGGTGTFLWNF